MITTFVYLHGVENSDVSVCLATTVLISVGYAIHWRLNKDIDRYDFANSAGSFCFLSLILAFLTPVL